MNAVERTIAPDCRVGRGPSLSRSVDRPSHPWRTRPAHNRRLHRAVFAGGHPRDSPHVYRPRFVGILAKLSGTVIRRAKDRRMM